MILQKSHLRYEHFSAIMGLICLIQPEKEQLDGNLIALTPLRHGDMMHHLYHSYHPAVAVYVGPAGLANPLGWKNPPQNENRGKVGDIKFQIS